MAHHRKKRNHIRSTSMTCIAVLAILPLTLLAGGEPVGLVLRWCILATAGEIAAFLVGDSGDALSEVPALARVLFAALATHDGLLNAMDIRWIERASTGVEQG
jgi:hypothetical protein